MILQQKSFAIDLLRKLINPNYKFALTTTGDSFGSEQQAAKPNYELLLLASAVLRFNGNCFNLHLDHRVLWLGI
jgi:hypothetical protein